MLSGVYVTPTFSEVMSRVAVVDLGSNSLKLIIADGPPMVEVSRAPAEVRIFPEHGDKLTPEAIQAATDAVDQLVTTAKASGAERIILMGTSALRDAPNRAQFAYALKERTGLDLSVISGETEARIGIDGILLDPALAAVRNCITFDLGGGSMQIGRVIERRCVQAKSLSLGAVRMTKAFLDNRGKALDAHDIESLRHHALEIIQPHLQAGVALGAPLIGAGGALATMVDLFKAAGESHEGGEIGVLTLHNWLTRLSTMDLETRRAVPGMPPARADILPAALVVICALADHMGAESIRLTHHGIRHGMANMLLSEHGELLA